MPRGFSDAPRAAMLFYGDARRRAHERHARRARLRREIHVIDVYLARLRCRAECR